MRNLILILITAVMFSGPAAALAGPGKTGQAAPRAIPGFDVRVVDGKVVVVRVSAGLPAAKAGVRPGWLVCKINDKDLAPTLLKIRQALKKERDVPLEQALEVRDRLR